ncbi:MAG: hypothetical protein R3F39_24780 [Myxococcota bacterium]
MSATQMAYGDSRRAQQARPSTASEAATQQESPAGEMVHEASTASALHEGIGGSGATIQALHEAGGNAAVHEATRGSSAAGLGEQDADGADMLEGDGGAAGSGGGRGRRGRRA